MLFILPPISSIDRTDFVNNSENGVTLYAAENDTINESESIFIPKHSTATVEPARASDNLVRKWFAHLKQ